MAHTPLDNHILNLLEKNGEMRSRDIYATKPEVSEHTIRSRIGKLKNEGKIEKVKNGVYRKSASSPDTPTRPDEELQQISEALRSADANKKTIDKLLNIYDGVLDNYETWVADNVGSGTDFEKQLLFIENFKWLTAIGDKLMKRWSLEHVGYDTNSRQAQEDAKAKTEERQKEALKDAPLRDRVMIVGKYDPEAEELLDCIPSSLEQMTDEDQEKMKV